MTLNLFVGFWMICPSLSNLSNNRLTVCIGMPVSSDIVANVVPKEPLLMSIPRYVESAQRALRRMYTHNATAFGLSQNRHSSNLRSNRINPSVFVISITQIHSVFALNL